MEARIERILILYESEYPGGDFGLSMADGFRAHGCEVEFAPRQEPWREDYDLVLAYGPFGPKASMLFPGRALLARPPALRPVFVWWLTEGIPQPALPPALVLAASRFRVSFDQAPVFGRARGLLERGHRLRILGELDWLRSRNLLDVLAVTSGSRAAYLERHGFQPITVSLGYHPCYGTDLNLERDIDVTFLGSTVAPRRRAYLEQTVRALAARNIRVCFQGNLYGEERTRLLNRSKILLNILRAPQDFVGQRCLLAAANKALMISEPVTDTRPFCPGEHFVVAPVDRLAGTIEYYLAHSAERIQLAEQAYALATRELTVAGQVGLILRAAQNCRPNLRSGAAANAEVSDPAARQA